MAHIGIDARLTYYRTGGISAYTRQLVGALGSLQDQLPTGQRHRFTVFLSRKARFTLGQHTAKLWTPAHHRFERVALSLELARFGLDVLHSPDFIPPVRGARRHVITVHDLTFLHYPQYLTADSRRYYNDQIETAVRHADHILTVSESARADLMALLGVLPEKITVQPHGVGPQFQPQPSEVIHTVRKRFGLPEDFILFVGTLEPRKNIDGLLDACQRLPNAPVLVLVGRKGWLIDETLARIAQSPRVMVVDNASDDDLPALYTMARLLVLPSFYEGFGMPALEAMACGTIPVVAGRGSLPEVVGACGVLVNPDDPDSIAAGIEQVLYASAEWLAAMRAAARARAASFTWENSARIALSVYHSVLGL